MMTLTMETTGETGHMELGEMDTMVEALVLLGTEIMMDIIVEDSILLGETMMDMTVEA